MTISGRDLNGYVNVIWNITKCGKINNEKSPIITEAIKFVLLVVKKFCLIGKYCEKFNFIVDLGEKAIPVKNMGMIKSLDALFNNNFNTFINKTIIYRPPKLFNALWKVVTKMAVISQRDLEKVIVIKKGDEETFKSI